MVGPRFNLDSPGAKEDKTSEPPILVVENKNPVSSVSYNKKYGVESSDSNNDAPPPSSNTSLTKIEKVINDTYGDYFEKDQGQYEQTNQLEYAGLIPIIPPLSRIGNQTLRGGQRNYNPCVMDRTGWQNYFSTLPVDYDVRNDPVFDCQKSTYKRLMNIDAPVPEPTTAEMLRTGYCGPDSSSLTRPAFLRDIHNDNRPEPAFRLHLVDRTALHFTRADSLEGAIPFGRQGDMIKAKSVSHRDYKWRICCPAKPPSHPTMERKVYHYAKTDLHGRLVNQVIKFDDDQGEYMNQKLMKLKKAYLWPINPITGESLGGKLEYPQHDPCTEYREQIWPCGEKNILEYNPIQIPCDRCQLLAHRPKNIPRTRERHFHQKSYLDMRYPIRNFECWEEVPDCCSKPNDIPSECCFTKVNVDLPYPTQKSKCPPQPPCQQLKYSY